MPGRTARILTAVALACGLTACGTTEQGSLLDKETLTVGVRPDLPGLGLKRKDGTFEGFDIDVARYVARKIDRDVRFVPALASDRIPFLVSGRVDMMLATLSITPDRKTEIAYAGPYFVSYQDIMVRQNDRARGVRDLKGRRFCAVKGSDPARRVATLRGMTVVQVPADHYDQCMSLLKADRIDAITTNDVILAGLIKREGRGLRLVGAQISEQHTAIGIRRGDPDACEALNRAITQMYQDGTAQRLVRKWFSGTGLDLTHLGVPQFEGCL
ncbi:transporter substrate-binding domain-containing protein [Spirillospora sp. CA-294931]|uniref:transporter substrate-binding domain-containing protein n=1 Tax=Spirillospora sp. CA-294931 TaxID=3240042 RepID=UPI003D9286AE